ncbi:conserved protein of unknown function [Sterolibacterium denitrificans]|uniref:Uncharacterized protein n=2 Tax=Sterolibacterium denitrificans TaxID=157592 RepID=A0A656ZA15_9PROT|nr:DUF1840 domain-containing protein [Sterolibacterium denitrificans]KYC29346.1 hypothetical protein ACY05_02130 [Sterolibacterium denitrificans]SMB30971.1 conserved protein of unknown function [Sterolibacterium denitrificans]
MSIVTFRSRATADVIMFGEVAHRLMRIMGKEVAAQGIVTVEQLPDAIARLRAAIEQDKGKHAGLVAEAMDALDALDAAEAPGAGAAAEARPDPMAQPVSLTQRAVPLLEMLERSQRHVQPVVWGV